MKIGIIGIGGMGSGMLCTLLREGFDVSGFDLNDERMSWLQTQGAQRMDSPVDLIKECDPVILSLPSSKVTETVLRDSVLPNAIEGQTIIDAGTTVAERTREFYAAFKDKGVNFLDAPVSGGPGGAESGNLFIFVGGDKEVADKHWPILQKLGKQRLTYCGPSGTGQITKAVNQLAMGLTSAAFLEALAFGVNAGVGIETLVDATGGDTGMRGSIRQMGTNIANDEGDGFDVKYAEFPYFLAESKHVGFEMPILSTLYDRLSQLPDTHRDNMNRPYPPYWSSLTKNADTDKSE